MKQAFTFFTIILLCITCVIIALIRNDPATTIEKYKSMEANKNNTSSGLFPSKIDLNININVKLDRNSLAAMRALAGSGTGSRIIENTPFDNSNEELETTENAEASSSIHRHPTPELFKPVSPTAEKTLVVAISQEPDSLDPIFQEMLASKEFYGHMFRQLTEIDHNWKVYPELAKEVPTFKNGLWEILEGGKMRTTFHLRDAKWSDGHPLTAEDFLFAYEVMMDELQPVVSRDVYEKIEKMESKDKGKTLVITWNKTYAYAVEDDIFVLPKHQLESIYRKDPVKYHTHPKVARMPVGNGPFRIKEWISGSHITLERNPFWYGKQPHFEEIIYQIVRETNLLEDKVVYNEVQMLSPVGMTLDQARRLKRRHGDKVHVEIKPGLVWEHIDCNLDNPLMKDQRVRQALMYGMDREELVSLLFDNQQTVAHSWLPSQHYAYNPDLKKYEYNPKKGKKLLEEAGWRLTDNQGNPYSDGIRRNASEEKLEIIIMTTTGNKTREEVELLLQSQWKKIGVNTIIKNEPAKVFFGATTSERRYPHLAMYAWSMSHFSDGESLWTIKNIPTSENSWQGQNYPGWRNEESNAIDLKVPTVLEKAKRKEMLHKQQAIWVEEVPSLPLYFRSDAVATHKKLINVYITGSDSPISWCSEYWGYSE